jgi:hypothetical protein
MSYPTQAELITAQNVKQKPQKQQFAACPRYRFPPFSLFFPLVTHLRFLLLSKADSGKKPDEESTSCGERPRPAAEKLALRPPAFWAWH